MPLDAPQFTGELASCSLQLHLILFATNVKVKSVATAASIA